MTAVQDDCTAVFLCFLKISSQLKSAVFSQ